MGVVIGGVNLFGSGTGSGLPKQEVPPPEPPPVGRRCRFRASPDDIGTVISTQPIEPGRSDGEVVIEMADGSKRRTVVGNFSTFWQLID